jgi:peptidoglycan/LPS O-acetylase OafA/YrhL
VTTLSEQTTPSGNQAASSGEYRGLTGLRIVAAVWVVVFHFHFTPLSGVAEVVGVLGPLITSGALGVDLFFVLSGFVIAYTYLDQLGPGLRARPAARFLWARICRMWPVYAVVFHLFGIWLVARLVFGSDSEIAFQAVQPAVDAGQYVQQLLLVQLWDDAFLDGASWVGPTWSISAEWLAYLLFPVAALGFFRLRNLPVAASVAASVALMTPIALAYVTTGSPYYPGSWLVRILCGFAGGVFMYLAVRRLRDSERTRRTASWLAACLPVLIGAGLLLGGLVAPGRGGAVIVLFPLLVGALAVADRGPARLLATRWAVYGGRISYSLYLVHIPIFEVYWLALRRFEWLRPDGLAAHVVGVLAVLTAFVVAAVAFRWVEEPARRRMRTWGPAGAWFRVPRRGGIRPPAGPATPPAVAVPAADDTALVSVAARIAAERRALAAVWGRAPEPGVQPGLSPLAGVLITAQQRRPTAGADLRAAYDRSEYVRGGYLHAGK